MLLSPFVIAVTVSIAPMKAPRICRPPPVCNSTCKESPTPVCLIVGDSVSIGYDERLTEGFLSHHLSLSLCASFNHHPDTQRGVNCWCVDLRTCTRYCTCIDYTADDPFCFLPLNTDYIFLVGTRLTRQKCCQSAKYCTRHSPETAALAIRVTVQYFEHTCHSFPCNLSLEQCRA